MKKFSFLLAMMLVLAFASSAFAAQTISNATYENYLNKNITYNATTNVLDGKTYATGTEFNADGKTMYPYEIYLPNEQNPASYRIHSNYTKNTDACAACHATHTAVGNSLLQWYTVYDTCMACHDGTVTTTYNVQEGKIGTGNPTFGGMFGNGNEKSLSNHNVTGAMEIAAAPGGSVIGNETVAGAHGEEETRWVTEFGCESCHTPHGQGGNARILHPDANYAASYAAKAQDYKYYVSTTSGYVYATEDMDTDPLYIIKGYPYSPVVYVDGAKPSGAPIAMDNVTGKTYVLAAVGQSEDYTIETGVAAIQVKMDIDNYLNGATETVTHVAGMNAYCGACHTDYNTATYKNEDGEVSGSANAETGVYSKAHRHQVGFDIPYFNFSKNNMIKESGKMTCLTCHVAHGTSQDYWARTLSTKGDAYWVADSTDPKYQEIAGSSALKRLPNMGTCEACHGKAGGNEGYGENTGMGAIAATANVADAAMPNTYNFKITAASYLTSDLGWVGNAKCLGCHEEYVKGWRTTKHATSSHTGGCGGCHNPGNTIMGNNGTFATALAGDGTNDAGITCESCHGTGARHIAAPSSKNIFNPGATDTKRQTIECSRCHDMYNNSLAGTYGSLATTSGSAYLPATVKTTQQMYDRADWSVAFRAYQDDPAKFAIASQMGTQSNHYGGSWGYADSKHFIGTGTSANPNGIVTCNTCHNMHSENEGLLRVNYGQLCASCHDYGASFSPSVAMPTNAWNRHQIHTVDYAHSFKFGNPATIAAVTVKPVNLEYAGTDRQCPEVDTYYTRSGAGGAYDALGVNGVNIAGAKSLWRGGATGQMNAGGIGLKIAAFSDVAKTTQVFNNYELHFELIEKPAGVTLGDDIEFVEHTGAIEFINNPYNGTAYDINDYQHLHGTYKVKWTSVANPALTGVVTITVQEQP